MRIGCIPFWTHFHFQRCFQCMWVGSWEATGFLQTSSHGWLLIRSELPTSIPQERSSQVGVPWGLGWAESSTSRKSQRLSKFAPWEKVKAKELKTVILKCNALAGMGDKVNRWGARGGSINWDHTPAESGLKRPELLGEHSCGVRVVSFWELSVSGISRFLWDKGTGLWARTVPWLTPELTARNQQQIMQELLVFSSPFLSHH